MKDANTCSAWLPGVFCRNGFTITQPCNPGRVQPVSLPQCCDEEWCGKVFPDTGLPPAECMNLAAQEQPR